MLLQAEPVSVAAVSVVWRLHGLIIIIMLGWHVCVEEASEVSCMSDTNPTPTPPFFFFLSGKNPGSTCTSTCKTPKMPPCAETVAHAERLVSSRLTSSIYLLPRNKNKKRNNLSTLAFFFFLSFCRYHRHTYPSSRWRGKKNNNVFLKRFQFNSSEFN